MVELTITEIADIPKTLCLNMIVKNESKIIRRLFDSVLSIIDSYCICDTGSTDDTVEIIKTYFNEKNIPGKVVVEPFKNFCHNRNFSLQSAVGMSDYLLFMDADMLLEFKQFDKQILGKADSYHLLQGNDSFYYQNVRIVKNNGLYSYAGVTHEYINTPANSTLLSIPKNVLFIRDIGDGGAKSDKFERDIRLLTEGIKDEPNNVRYYFYLANSYFDHGEHALAIDIYKKRIEMGGWNQEVWYSYFRIGLCHKHLGNMPAAIYSWMAGYDFLPDRVEGLYEIINHYRNISKHKICFCFYQLALDVLKKNNNLDGYLFLHKDVYSFQILYEFTIIAIYVGIKNINNEVVAVLNNCPAHNIVNNLFSNMKFYKNVITPIKTINLDSKTTITINNENIDFLSSSSCLIKNPNQPGYIMNIRYVNYYIMPGGSYINCDKHIITSNKYVELNSDLNIISEKLFDTIFCDRRYIGVEDVKIFYESNNNESNNNESNNNESNNNESNNNESNNNESNNNESNNNKILFIGTGFHAKNCIGIVCGDYDAQKGELLSTEVTSSFNKSNCEKNWVYVTYKNETHIVYKWYPLQICKMDKDRTQIHVVETKEMRNIFSHVRGSSCGFNYKNEIWFVVHLVSYENPRHYYHMLVVFDKNMNLQRYSAPFKFEGEPIEYSLSIVVEDERVLINYSTWDRTTRIGIYDKKYIDSIINYC
jgi:tetratricopeptide (TPR) repeat protein